MRVLIIEDENLTATRLQGMLEKYDSTIRVEEILPSVKSTKEWLSNNEPPDLIFMDIHLEDDLAFSIFKSITLEVPVIFTTAYDDYMIQAFKVNSVDYLLKPLNYEELSKAIDKFKSIHKKPKLADMEKLLALVAGKEAEFKERFMIQIGTKIKSIEISEVSYFYSEDKLTFLVMNDGHAYPIEYSLDKLAGVLDTKVFFRINRQMIISYRSVKQVLTHVKGKIKLELKPSFKDEVMVSGDRMTDFKEWLGK